MLSQNEMKQNARVTDLAFLFVGGLGDRFHKIKTALSPHHKA